jgi:hypothetical protein
VSEVVYDLEHATIEYLHRHPVKIEQIMEMLKTILASMDAHQVKEDACTVDISNSAVSDCS